MKSRVSRFSRVLTAFVYLSSVSYFATTENQILHAYKDWTGLISTDDSIISSKDISVNMSEDMAVSNDTPASSDNESSDNDNEDPESDSFDSFVSHDTTGEEADTEDSAENTGNTLSPVNPVAPVASGPDEDNNTNNTNNDNNPNNPNDSESIAILTTRLTSDHHLIATLSISGIMGADVAVFPNTTGSNTTNATGPSTTAPNTGSDEFTSAGGNIYTVSNNAGSSAVASLTDSADIDDVDDVDKPDSLLLNFENEEGVVESVRLWLDNEIDETVILDGISIPSDDTINTNSNGNDSGSSSNDSNNSNNSNNGFSSRAADGSNSNRSSQSDLPRLAVPLSPVLSEAASSDLAAIPDAKNISDTKNIPDIAPDTASVPAPVLGHSLESFIGLDQLASPIIVILPSTNEQYYFANGKALAAYDRFDQEYKISEINATTRAEIEVRLVRK